MDVIELIKQLKTIIEDSPIRGTDDVVIKIGDETFTVDSVNHKKTVEICLVSTKLSTWKGSVTRFINQAQALLSNNDVKANNP